ncbi:MAG TPA: sialate O-acetylesterase, partial [Pirellulales bacterium]|nr:sialate O-acetylesterase [Pirellulales bacterium]
MKVHARFAICPATLRALAVLAGIVCGGAPSSAAVKLPAIFSDHMVIQAGTEVPVWGLAEPGEEVTVSLAGQNRSETADAAGKWRVKLEALEPSDEPQVMHVTGRNALAVSDVLVGEVWLASGQSNMEMQLARVDRAPEEQAAANYPRMRMFIYDHPYNIYELAVPPSRPQADGNGRWWVCTPENAARFSALGYFFARDLQRQLGTSVGIIDAAVGGTPIEAWTSLAAQQADLQLQDLLTGWRQTLSQFNPEQNLQAFNAAKKAWLNERSDARRQGRPDPKAPAAFKNLRVMEPGGLFNGVIAPLVPYAIRGVIWYQGERNAQGPTTGLYGEQLTTLIGDWRTRWGDDFYFAWVQLPNYQRPQREPSEPAGWGVAVRDGMRRALALPRTGMAVTIDLGGATAGHPTNKADFARRLSLLALHDVYRQPITIWCGPIFRSARRAGDKMVITLDHASGLKAAPAAGANNSPGELRGFAIAGSDRKFVW